MTGNLTASIDGSEFYQEDLQKVFIPQMDKATLATKCGDLVDATFDVPVRDLISAEKYVSKQGHEWWMATIGLGTGPIEESGATDFGRAAVNAIRDAIVLQFFGDFGYIDLETGEIVPGHSTMMDHRRVFDPASTQVYNARYAIEGGRFHRYSYHGYRYVIADNGDTEEHVEALRAKHGEIDRIMHLLLEGKRYRVHFAGSESARFERNVLQRLDVTFEQALKEAASDTKTSAFFADVKSVLGAEGVKMAASVKVDGLDLATQPLPFIVSLVSPDFPDFPVKYVVDNEDLRKLVASESNAQKIADGKLIAKIVG
jgi:hypothetical protein